VNDPDHRLEKLLAAEKFEINILTGDGFIDMRVSGGLHISFLSIEYRDYNREQLNLLIWVTDWFYHCSRHR